MPASDGSEEVIVDGLVTRREERLPTNWIAMIRLFDGTEIPCTVKDISKSGAKLGVPGSAALPPGFMLKVVGRDFVLRVTLAWRRGNYAGVRIDRIAKLSAVEERPAAGATVKPSGYHSIGSRGRR